MSFFEGQVLRSCIVVVSPDPGRVGGSQAPSMRWRLAGRAAGGPVARQPLHCARPSGSIQTRYDASAVALATGGPGGLELVRLPGYCAVKAASISARWRHSTQNVITPTTVAAAPEMMNTAGSPRALPSAPPASVPTGMPPQITVR